MRTGLLPFPDAKKTDDSLRVSTIQTLERALVLRDPILGSLAINGEGGFTQCHLADIAVAAFASSNALHLTLTL